MKNNFKNNLIWYLVNYQNEYYKDAYEIWYCAKRYYSKYNIIMNGIYFGSDINITLTHNMKK